MDKQPKRNERVYVNLSSAEHRQLEAIAKTLPPPAQIATVAYMLVTEALAARSKKVKNA